MQMWWKKVCKKRRCGRGDHRGIQFAAESTFGAQCGVAVPMLQSAEHVFDLACYQALLWFARCAARKLPFFRLAAVL
jgi:hypothetical protein